MLTYIDRMTENNPVKIRKGFSITKDPQLAAKEFYESIVQPNITLAVFFCSPAYDRVELARALKSQFGDIPLIGCTTAGEITPAGYQVDSLTGFSLAAPDFVAVTRTINDLETFSFSEGRGVSQSLHQKLSEGNQNINGDNTFAFLMIDGMSLKTEMVTHALHSGLVDILLVGGSAGCNPADLENVKTFLYSNGEFCSNRAILTLVKTTHPFVVFKTENFVPTSTKMVITEAQPGIRLVKEINGEPAAKEYIHLAGVPEDTPMTTISATHPVGVYAGGQFYLRAVGWAHEDQSITFTCAIDEGAILTLGEQVEYIQNLKHQFEKIYAEIGHPELVLAFDCLSRLWEMDRSGIKDEVGEIMIANNAIGFSTYGEQFNSMHMNQTLTGVAIGKA